MVTNGKPASHRLVLSAAIGGVVLSAAVGVHTCCTPIIPPDVPVTPIADAAFDVTSEAASDVAAPDSGRCIFVGPRKRTSSRGPKIVGGTPAAPGAFPFAVGLGVAASSGYFQYCGGSSIGDRFVLTAAHCQVDVGDYALVGSSDLKKAKAIRVTESRIHPSFSDDTLDFDVAVAVLESPSSVPIVPIATSINSMDATVIGWGKTSEGGQTTNFLREVTIPLWEMCPADYGPLSSRQLCAGAPGGGKDSCQGDSGGALLTWNVDHWEQLGVVSWGIGCARPNYPGVYTDLRNNEIATWVKECGK